MMSILGGQIVSALLPRQGVQGRGPAKVARMRETHTTRLHCREQVAHLKDQCLPFTSVKLSRTCCLIQNFLAQTYFAHSSCLLINFLISSGGQGCFFESTEALLLQRLNLLYLAMFCLAMTILRSLNLSFASLLLLSV